MFRVPFLEFPFTSLRVTPFVILASFSKLLGLIFLSERMDFSRSDRHTGEKNSFFVLLKMLHYIMKGL